MKIGAHISIAGGLAKSIERAVVRGVATMQIFASSPRTWQAPAQDKKEIKSFRLQAKKYKISPIFIHAKYLINLASPSQEILTKSVKSLKEDLDFAFQIGASGTIVHVGSHKGNGLTRGMKQIVNACREVLTETPPGTWLILENTAGSKQQSIHKIGSRFEEIGEIIRKINSSRIKICLDTQHSFASGYNLASEKELELVLSQFDKSIGLKRLVVVHVNDSVFKLGSGKDRHANVGEGKIGERGLRLILQDQNLRKLPFILETPALDREKTAIREVEVLQRIAFKVL